jgi:hypothetical protein
MVKVGLFLLIAVGAAAVAAAEVVSKLIGDAIDAFNPTESEWSK